MNRKWLHECVDFVRRGIVQQEHRIKSLFMLQLRNYMGFVYRILDLNIMRT